jgi:uncharacterized protein YbbC (DUF1343 family)
VPRYFAPILLLLLSLDLFAPQVSEQRVVVGAERMDVLLPLLQGKKVALVVNHSSMVGDTHLADTLKSRGVEVAVIFAPEHGFRGDADAGEQVRDGWDLRTGAPIVSLYGKKKKPLRADWHEADIVLFDIQDVGARFYTYISTLFYVLEACAEQQKPIIVLDRPNPNGHYVDGPVLDMKHRSFIGIAPLPIVHGCTIGELARMFAGECWIGAHSDSLDLSVVPCLRYTHQTPYEPPQAPSPNLPTYRSVLLYPSLCLFEGSTCSVGRGTDWPFEVVGHPDFPKDSLSFVPRPNRGNKAPLHSMWVCGGWDFRHVPTNTLWQQRALNIEWFIEFYRLFPNKPAFFRKDRFMELLVGKDDFRKQVVDGLSAEEIRAGWQPGLDSFRLVRQRYLLYLD